MAATLIALTALPGAWLDQVPGNAFGPATAWAGGTPDETLAPPPAPPKKTRDAPGRYEHALPAPRAAVVDGTTRRPSDKFDRMMALWTVLRATTLRM